MRINLLPEAYRPEPPVNPFRLVLLISCSVLLFVGAGWGIFQQFQLGNEKQLLAAVKQEVETYQPVLRETEQLERRLQALRKQLGEVEKIQAAYLQYPLVLKHLAGALEPGMWFESIKMDPNSPFNLSGKTILFAKISGFLENLRTVPELTSVKLNQVIEVSADHLNLYNFGVKLQPVGGAKTDAKKAKKK
jgi:Tfp pilus assembly protein PilN